MTLKRYLSTLVSPVSPHRPRTSIESPVSVRSPIEDLRDFWKKTFEESLGRGEEYREAALAGIHAQRGLLSDAEVWDLQTMNDGLMVERDDLSDFAQSPERLSFDIVSRASRYKSRAQSLYSEVKEVVRRSQASLDSAHRVRAPDYPHAARRGMVTRHADVSGSLPREASATYSLSHESRYANGRYAGAEHCVSPPAYDDSSSSSCDSRSQAASFDRHEALIGSVSKPHGSLWEIVQADENYGTRQASLGPGTNETMFPRLETQPVDVGKWIANTGRYMDIAARRRGVYTRRSTQSDLSEQSEFSPGPPTPHSSPQSSPPSANLSASPAFLKKLDDALKGLNVTSSECDVGSAEDHSQEFTSMISPTSPTRLLRHDKMYMLRGPRDPIRATQSQLNPVLPLPFRPVPDLRRAASQPQLQSRGPRERLPVLFTREDMNAIRVLTDELRSPISPQSDDEDEFYEEELFTDECTVETASVIVQPYGHSRANTIDRPIIYSREDIPFKTATSSEFERAMH
ncbi:hypothetical protein DAEQUDRAFT_96452 [Daedalea quercina L-15889]|uniref:Uncharacterized protein n=1 Tax=Daedalea quercina L-15889 TaxID=1314783 RepID=A0A165SBJ0_9APHY|nr:hypothetical protein DAEQUDRAFT_96452 [Daedalea quercina L-15889]